MKNNHINLIKLCVGIDTVDQLVDWRNIKRAEVEARGEIYRTTHVTRMWPKRAQEILDGGSLYWVIKGFVLIRQRITALEERIGVDGVRRCAIVMDPEMIRTAAAPRRPFQGWRYLQPDDSPTDLPHSRLDETPLPDDLDQALSNIGLL